MGEPAGVGGDVTLKAWLARKEGVPAFFAIDDPDRLAGLARALSWPVPVRVIDRPDQAAALFPEALPVLPEPLAKPAVAGKLDPANANNVLRAIARAVTYAQKGEAGAVVTNPIHKKVLVDAGFHHPGHTEYLAELAGDGSIPVMMLACEELRVVPVTVHLPLRKAIEQVTAERVTTTGPWRGSTRTPAKAARWAARRPRSSAPP
jgi:4-hydroxythreonine-4-phosphate dehydrogenase